MNTLIRSFFAVGLVALIASVTSLGFAQPAQAQAGQCDADGAQTIAAVVVATSTADGFDSTGTDFDMLLAALTAASLDGVVATPASVFTVFAPTDAAFIALAQDLGYTGSDEQGAFDAIVAALTTLGNGDPIPVLTAVLQYHLVGSFQDASAVTAATSLTTIQGGAIAVSGTTLTDLAPALADATIIATDIGACNGVIHGIDRVMLPIAVEPAVTPEPTATAEPVSTESAAIVESPGTIGTAPAGDDNGAFGFGINAVAGDATTVPAAVGGTGGGDAGAGLAVTGNSTEAAFAVALGLFAVGGSFVVSGRRRQR